MDRVPRVPIIPSSANDLARQRLESTVNQSLHSLSLNSFLSSTLPSASLPSAPSVSDTGSDADLHAAPDHGPSIISSSSTLSSVEYPRTAPVINSRLYQHHLSADDTPRAHGHLHSHPGQGKAGWTSAVSTRPASPVSTAGHHVSALSLGDGVFARAAARRGGGEADGEFDPERSLGRLVGELGRAMGERLQARPVSPFSPTRSPRSPSPLPSMLNPSHPSKPRSKHRNPSLSLTLSRADPLPSPPTSRSSSGSGSTSHEGLKQPGPVSAAALNSGFSSLARQLDRELRPARVEVKSAPSRAPLGETNRHNITANAKAGVQQAQKAKGRKGLADVTGMSSFMRTPGKGLDHGTLGRDGDVGGEGDATIQRALAELQARLRALENENTVSRRRVRELEGELERAKEEVAGAQKRGEERLREAVGEKTALEELVRTLRAHLARLTVELEEHKGLVASLRMQQTSTDRSYVSPPRAAHATEQPSSSVAAELRALKTQVERLGTEVHKLGGIVVEGLETRRRARGEETIRLKKEQEENQARQEAIERAARDVQSRQARARMEKEGVLIDLHGEEDARQAQPSKLRQGLHQAAVPGAMAGLMPPTVEAARTRSAPTRMGQRDEGPQTRAPDVDSMESDAEDQARGLDEGSDKGLDSPTPLSRPSSRSLPVGTANKNARDKPSKATRPVRAFDRSQAGPGSPFPSIREEDEASFFSASPSVGQLSPVRLAKKAAGARTGTSKADRASGGIPPQTVLARVVRELEDDFAHYRSVYAELADSYKLLDPSGSTAKRRVLAEHLKEVIDTLEAKAEHIAALYSLLEYNDRPLVPAAGETEQQRRALKSVPDVLRMVKESLGEEAVRRLRADGVKLRF